MYLSGWILTRFCNAYIHITFPCMYSIISYRIKGLTCIFLKTQYPSSLEPRTFSKWEFGVSRSGVKYMRCISGSSWILATKVLIASSIWTPKCLHIHMITVKFKCKLLKKIYQAKIKVLKIKIKYIDWNGMTSKLAHPQPKIQLFAI